MAKTVFVSIVHEDKLHTIHVMKDWKKNGRVTNIDFNFEEKDLRTEGRSAVEKYLKELIDSSQYVLFIIGKDTHNREWIKWEYQYAVNSGKKLVYMHIQGYKGGLPDLFPRINTMEFNLENFKAALGC